jgi:hypothetical protein
MGISFDEFGGGVSPPVNERHSPRAPDRFDSL